MTQAFTLRNVFLLAAAVLFLNGGFTSAQENSSLAKRDQDSATNLYLMRYLDHTLMTWKSPTEDPAELGAWIFATRNRLIALKKTAELQRRDEHIIRAYGDVLDLLTEYERFLRDIVYFELTANVARPELKTFKEAMANVTGDALSMAQAGGAVGTYVPIVGNVVGAAGGAAVGAGTAAVKWFTQYEEAISKNERIDAAVKAARLQLIAHVSRQFKSTIHGLKVVAENLASSKMYGWREEVGFDNSELDTYEAQLRRRPNDPFVYAALGIRAAASNPSSAAKLLVRAAELVPPDANREVHHFDLDRAEYLLAAARIAERGARNAGDRSGAELAEKAVAYYRDACRCLEGGDKALPREVKLAYARACALAGLAREANAVMERLLVQAPDEPWLHYEFAGVESMLHNQSAALQHLRRSFNLKARWQPHALRDSRLAYLNATVPDEVERICANPIVGRWTGSDGLVLDFYMNGSMKQSNRSGTKEGTYEQIDGQNINLITPDKTKPFRYSVTKTQLKLEGGGKTFELSRSVPHLLGAWKYESLDSLEFRDDGTWKRQKGPKVTTGTFLIVPRSGGSDAEVWWIEEDALLRRESRFAYQAQDDSLKIKRLGEANWHTYTRER